MPTLPMFLNNFIKKYPKVKLMWRVKYTKIIIKLNNGHFRRDSAATPLLEKIKGIYSTTEPFMAYIPENHRIFKRKESEVTDLNLDWNMCFKMGIVLEMEFWIYVKFLKRDRNFQIEVEVLKR
jgi:hypothetical protein